MSTDTTAPSLPEFTLEKGRYRLYVATVCVFSHRVRLMRLLQKNVEDIFLQTFVDDKNKELGWYFDQAEPEFGAKTLKEVYAHLNPDYEGAKSVPLIVDRTNKTMTNNESLEIAIAFAKLPGVTTLLPEGAEALAKEIGSSLTLLPYKFIMSGKKPEVQEALWTELDKYEKQLQNQPYLMGDNISVADCILWATLIRVDNIYVRQFGLNAKTLQKDYPNLTAYLQRIWKTPSNLKSGATLGEEAKLPEMIPLYWTSDQLSPLAGNDPKAAVPEMIPLV